MWLRKDQGGCEITYRGAVYAWGQDGDVTDVPHELGVDLVQIGGYQVAESPEPESEGGDGQGDGSAGDAPGGEAGQAGPDPEPEPEPAKPAPRRRKGSAAAGNDQA